nr:MAG TPA: hypothetical protein [Caudoviricetes sp.]
MGLMSSNKTGRNFKIFRSVPFSVKILKISSTLVREPVFF